MVLRGRNLSLGQALMLFAVAAPVACRGSLCLAGPPDEETQGRRRAALVELLRPEIQDARVLAAIGKVPRHRFVPPGQQEEAYANYPLSIGSGQTISQPFIVAFMTQELQPRQGLRVLEIGTGSGYQAAVLAELGAEVFSIEILPELSRQAGSLLRALGYADRVHLRVGDGFDGWPDKAPFDAVIVTAAPGEVPAPLVQQLREGGRMCIPVGGEGRQVLYTFEKRDGRLVELNRLDVRFVPMTGKALR